MKVESIFTVAKYDSLNPGDFFIHPLAGGHSPAIKVRRADGVMAVLDLDLEQQNGSRLPTLVVDDDFRGIFVICAPSAIIRTTDGLKHCLTGAGGAGNPRNGSFLVSEDGIHMRTKHQMHSLVFSLETGIQGTAKDSASCMWSDKWEIVVRHGNDTTIIFLRS